MGQTCWSKHGTELGMEYRARICGAYPHFMSFRPEWIALIFERIPTELVLQLKWIILLFYQFQDAPKKGNNRTYQLMCKKRTFEKPDLLPRELGSTKKNGGILKGDSSIKHETVHQAPRKIVGSSPSSLHQPLSIGQDHNTRSDRNFHGICDRQVCQNWCKTK